MKIYKCVNKFKASAIWIGILASVAVLFIFAKECKEGAVDGILMCLGILVPSLFPFMILSSFMAENSISQLVAPLFTPVSRWLLGLKGVCFIPVMLSLTGGYPIGARAISALFGKGLISKEEASQLALICCGAGPGFLITFVGISLMGSKEAGIILFCSQIISTVTLCIISRITFRNRSKEQPPSKPCSGESVSGALVSSVGSAVKASAGMCGFVVLFSVICNVIQEGLGIDGTLGQLTVSLLEITTGIYSIAGSTNLPVISFLLGFAGVCVHLQIFRELKGVEFSKLLFYIYRLMSGAISALATRMLLLAFPLSTEVFSSIAEKPQLSFYSGILGCCALVLTSALFLLSVRRKRLF